MAAAEAELPTAILMLRCLRYQHRDVRKQAVVLKSRQLSDRIQHGLMLTPFIIGVSALVLGPTIVGLPLAFTNYNGLQSPDWIGLDNFDELLSDSLFHTAIKNSLIYLAIATPCRILGGFLFALLMRRPSGATRLGRIAVYLPTVVPDVAWALIWLWILNPLYGPLNQLLEVIGLPTPDWLITERPTQFAIALMAAWQLGEGFVIMLATLQDVPAELYGQSAVDGASTWNSFWNVTLPFVSPILLVLLLRDTVLSLQGSFVPALVMTEGGPNNSTTYLPYYAYKTAFDYLRFGYAASMTLVIIAITAAAIILQFLVFRRLRPESASYE